VPQIWEKEKASSMDELRSWAKEDDNQQNLHVDYPDIPKNWGFMTLRRNKKK